MYTSTPLVGSLYIINSLTDTINNKILYNLIENEWYILSNKGFFFNIYQDGNVVVTLNII